MLRLCILCRHHFVELGQLGRLQRPDRAQTVTETATAADNIELYVDTIGGDVESQESPSSPLSLLTTTFTARGPPG